MPQSLTTHSTSELLIKKSRFIGCVQPVADRAAAQQVVAAHVCWALLAGRHSAAVDDDEPSGMAGRPMLEGLAPPGFGRRAGHGGSLLRRRKPGCRWLTANCKPHAGSGAARRT